MNKTVLIKFVCFVVLAVIVTIIYLFILKPKAINVNNSSVIYSEIDYAFANTRHEYSINKDEAVYRYYENDKLINEKYIDLSEEQYKELLEFIINKNKFFSMRNRDHKGNDGLFYVLRVSNGDQTGEVEEYLEMSGKMEAISSRIFGLFFNQ